MEVRRAEKYGFCAGVRVADQKVKAFAAGGGRDGRVLGQIVHNERVVQEMEALGVATVDDPDDATEGTIIFSAHGVPPSVHQGARSRGLRILDTTCPFVYDVHEEADRAAAAGEHLVFIGEPEHREVIGYTRDRAPSSYHVLSTVEEARAVDWSTYPRLRVLYQTTLNAEEYEDVVGYLESRVAVSRADTICYATKENQDAARELARDPAVDLILVVGGTKSANTRHLWEICGECKPSYLIQGPGDLRAEWFAGARLVGVTAGASTPDYVIDEVEQAVTAMQAGG